MIFVDQLYSDCGAGYYDIRGYLETMVDQEELKPFVLSPDPESVLNNGHTKVRFKLTEVDRLPEQLPVLLLSRDALYNFGLWTTSWSVHNLCNGPDRVLTGHYLRVEKLKKICKDIDMEILDEKGFFSVRPLDVESCLYMEYTEEIAPGRQVSTSTVIRAPEKTILEKIIAGHKGIERVASRIFGIVVAEPTEDQLYNQLIKYWRRNHYETI